MDPAALEEVIERVLRRVLAERDEPLVTTEEAAPQIGVSPWTLRRWLAEHRAAGLETQVTRAAVEYRTARQPILRWRVSVLKEKL